MAAHFLSLRMDDEEIQLVQQLHAKLGGSRSSVVKQALRLMAAHEQVAAAEPAPSLHALGAGRFGRHGDAGRQSADIKSVVRSRLDAKRGA